MEGEGKVKQVRDNYDQIISFKVGEEEYGLEILKVKEVIRVTEITRLPKVREFVKGVINLRGDVIPIIDLKERFGLARQDYTDASRVIVVEIGGKSVGMVVDSVSKVIRLESSQIEPPPELAGGMSSRYLRGVGKLEDRLVILIEIADLLTDDEHEEIDRVKQDASMGASVQA